MLNRKVTLATPKALDADTQITGGSIDYCYFSEDAMTPYMRGGAICETIPLAGLDPADQQLAEAFMGMLVRLMGEEVTSGTAKGRAEAARKAARAARSQEAAARAEAPGSSQP